MSEIKPDKRTSNGEKPKEVSVHLNLGQNPPSALKNITSPKPIVPAKSKASTPINDSRINRVPGTLGGNDERKSTALFPEEKIDDADEGIKTVKEMETLLKINLKQLIKDQLLAGAVPHDFKLRTIIGVLRIATVSGKNNESLMKIPVPVTICGDIHGQYHDLLRIFRTCGAPHKQRYLFLGDYVDRGKNSLEVIILLLMLQAKFPTGIYLLRGNHELRNINRAYGFHAELSQRYDKHGGTLWNKFNDVFALLPFAGLVNRKILCMHGGISPLLKSLDDIKKIPRGQCVLVKGSLEQDLLWADPEIGQFDYKPNPGRGVSVLFGAKSVTETLKRLNIQMIIRAHQVAEFGYCFFANKTMITVFSASRYEEDLCNYAAAVHVNAKMEINFFQFKPSNFDAVRAEQQMTADQSEGNE